MAYWDLFGPNGTLRRILPTGGYRVDYAPEPDGRPEEGDHVILDRLGDQQTWGLRVPPVGGTATVTVNGSRTLRGARRLRLGQHVELEAVGSDQPLYSDGDWYIEWKRIFRRVR